MVNVATLPLVNRAPMNPKEDTSSTLGPASEANFVAPTPPPSAAKVVSTTKAERSEASNSRQKPAVPRFSQDIAPEVSGGEATPLHMGDEEIVMDEEPSLLQSAGTILPDWNPQMDIHEYARICIPLLCKAMGVASQPDKSALVSGPLVQALRCIQTGVSQTPPTSDPAITGSSNNPLDVENYTADPKKEIEEALEDLEAAQDIKDLADQNEPTAVEITCLQSVVAPRGTATNATIVLELPRMEPAYAEVTNEDKFPPRISMQMRSIRTLRTMQMLDDTIIDAITQIKLAGNWFLRDERVLVPRALMEFMASDNRYDDTFMASNFPFLMHDNVIQIIWISYYFQHWICSCATVDGTIRIYNSAPAFGAKIAEALVLKQIRALTLPAFTSENWRHVDEWKVTFQPCVRQINGVDCGIHAIENAVDIFLTGDITATEVRDCEALRLQYLQSLRPFVQDAVVNRRVITRPAPSATADNAPARPANNITNAAVSSLPVAKKKEYLLAENEGRVWMPVNGPFKDIRLIFNTNRRSYASMIGQLVSDNPNKMLRISTIGALMKEFPDSRKRGSDLSYIKMAINKNPWFDIYSDEFVRLRNAEKYEAQISPVPILRIAGDIDAPETRSVPTFEKIKASLSPDAANVPTVYIVQIRASGAVNHIMSRKLETRGEQVWETYNRGFEINGVPFKCTQDTDLDSILGKQSIYVVSHQFHHSSRNSLFVEDQDDNQLAMRLLDALAAYDIVPRVVVIGTGMDGLSTNNDSWKKLDDRWPGFRFELCLLVPTTLRFLEDYPGLAVDWNPYPISSITTQCDNLLQAYNRLLERSEVISDLYDADDLELDEALVMAFEIFNNEKIAHSIWGRKKFADNLSEISQMLSVEFGLYCNRNSFDLDLVFANKETTNHKKYEPRISSEQQGGQNLTGDSANKISLEDPPSLEQQRNRDIARDIANKLREQDSSLVVSNEPPVDSNPYAQPPESFDPSLALRRQPRATQPPVNSNPYAQTPVKPVKRIRMDKVLMPSTIHGRPKSEQNQLLADFGEDPSAHRFVNMSRWALATYLSDRQQEYVDSLKLAAKKTKTQPPKDGDIDSQMHDGED